MKLGAQSVGRILRSALLAGLLVGAQVAGVPAPVSAVVAIGHQSGGTSIVVRPKTQLREARMPKARKLADDPRERKWRSRFLAHPVPEPMASSVLPDRSGRLAAAAAREASQRAATDACSGQISADTLYSCQTPSGTGTDTYTLTLSAAPDVLVFQTTTASGITLPITVRAPGGGKLSCQHSPVDECAASQQGTYKVVVSSAQATYTLEYTALLTETNCPAISLSFDAPSVTGSLTAGQPGACYSFSAPSGHILDDFGVPAAGTVNTAVFDAAGALVCAQVMGTCTLTGPGPYRVLASNAGQEDSYEFQLADLTDPSGCVQVAQQTFGDVPALSADPCSAVTVTATGRYQIYSVASNFETFPGTLHAADGSQACAGTGLSCHLAPGTYSFVQDFLLDGLTVSTVFIATAESRGCAAASDTSFASGDATGSFVGPGEELCRTLPTKAGLSDYLYSQPTSPGSAGEVLGVVDSAGAQMCPDAFEFLSFATCALTGTAPFRVILVPSGPGSQVRLLVQRTDSSAGCAAFPRSGYGNTAGAHVTLTKTANAKCFAIPAAAHSAAELVEDADATDGAAAALTVNGPSGKQLCIGNGFPTDWTICHYKAGVSYIAILVNTLLPGITDTYELVRRDFTGHAACSSPVSTTPGGPTTSFTLGASIAARCFRVSAAKGDRLIFSMRDSVPADPSAFDIPPTAMPVATNSGTMSCGFTLTCLAAGPAKFQVVVLAVDYTDVAIAVHLDVWRVATSAGWAPACTKHPFSAGTTSAPVSGTLTDSADLYCGVVDVQPEQIFDFYGSDTAIAPSVISVSLYTASSWANQGDGGCPVDAGPIFCSIGPVQQATRALLIVTPFDESQDPISFDLQGVCKLECSTQRPSPVYKSISPASQAAGQGNMVVLTGAGLDFSVPFNLIAKNGSVYSPSVPVSANAAGTRLTLRLDTTGVPPGTYDVSAGDFCSPTPCTDWLLNAYKVTKGPTAPPATRFVPLAPARILSTRTAAHGTLTFPVNGRGDVPVAHVAAVVLDVSAVTPSRSGFLTVFAATHKRPPAETVVFGTGRSATGLVTVPVVNGRVSVYNGSQAPVDLTADVLGYDTANATAGTGFTPVGPARILRSTQVMARRAHILTVAGADGVPPHGAEAVALDVTVTDPARAGHLIAYADGARLPSVASLSFAAGQKVTELVVARLTDGKVDLYDASSGSLKLSADAVGYYSATGSAFHPLNPLRVMDTRTGFGGAGEAILPHTAAKLSPLWDAVPSSGVVTAVVLNVTVLKARSKGALTVFPDSVLYQDGVTLPNSTSLPGTPNIAFLRGQVQSNLAIVPVGDLADFYNGSNGNLDVVADLEGYYTN